MCRELIWQLAGIETTTPDSTLLTKQQMHVLHSEFCKYPFRESRHYQKFSAKRLYSTLNRTFCPKETQDIWLGGTLIERF
jgi:hypothetical protein